MEEYSAQNNRHTPAGDAAVHDRGGYVTRIKKTSLYLAIGSLISLIIVPVLGVRTARAAGPDGTRQS
jgi:hypothetical protein